jgi:octaprenyl-diphosphate synthase
MKVVEQIKKPIYDEMDLFEQKFTESMSSQSCLTQQNYSLYCQSKRESKCDPCLFFWSLKLLGKGKVNERTFRGASVIELIHTATLVHDDVVDDSNKRRGFFSINALWKNKIAVLVGDYLLVERLVACLSKTKILIC